MHRSVLTQKPFNDFAKERLILVEVDFPESKPITPEQLKKNEALEKQFKIEGYPTLLILNGDGKELGKAAPTLEPAEFIKSIEAVLKG